LSTRVCGARPGNGCAPAGVCAGGRAQHSAQPRRTAITVGGTAFSIVAFVFLFGYYDGFSEQIIDNSTRYLTGHLQVERAGFRQDLRQSQPQARTVIAAGARTGSSGRAAFRHRRWRAARRNPKEYSSSGSVRMSNAR
jgi:hypothetical protein